MTATERRRNMYPANCKVCGFFVATGDGYLYRDTSSRAVRRAGHISRAPKFVKCHRCHTLKAAHRNDLPENRPASPAKVSVSDIRGAKLEYGATTRKYSGMVDKVVFLVLADGTKEVVAYEAPITAHLAASEFESGDQSFGGKTVRLSHGAAMELNAVAEAATDIYEDYFACGLAYGWTLEGE